MVSVGECVGTRQSVIFNIFCESPNIYFLLGRRDIKDQINNRLRALFNFSDIYIYIFGKCADWAENAGQVFITNITSRKQKSNNLKMAELRVSNNP